MNASRSWRGCAGKYEERKCEARYYRSDAWQGGRARAAAERDVKLQAARAKLKELRQRLRERWARRSNKQREARPGAPAAEAAAADRRRARGASSAGRAGHGRRQHAFTVAGAGRSTTSVEPDAAPLPGKCGDAVSRGTAVRTASSAGDRGARLPAGDQAAALPAAVASAPAAPRVADGAAAVTADPEGHPGHLGMGARC